MMPVTWYTIAALVLTNLVTGALWRFSANDVEKMKIQGKIAAQEAKRVIAEQERITDETVTGWKAALDVTRADYLKRLRIANVQPMPGISQGSARVDDLPTDALPLAAECAETTLMLENLQAWVKKQERVK